MNKCYLRKHLFLTLLTIIYQQAYAIELTETISIHGFLTQGAFNTTGNNYNGKSKNSISLDQTEIGLNMFWQASNKFDFAAQGLFRKAGQVDNGTVRLDYAMLNIHLFNNQSTHFGARLGRVKNPIGLYNETRDVAFTTPSILLPQSIYLDRSRSLFLSSDGIQAYADFQLGNGWLSVKANYGMARNDNNEIQKLMFGDITQGDLVAETPSFIGQVLYNIESDKYIFAISYADITLKYQPVENDIINAGSAQFPPVIFSAQYNGEKISLTGEYYYARNKFKDFGSYSPNYSPISTNWYLQASYRFTNQWQSTLRYDVNYLNKEDKNGSAFENVGLPTHMGYTKDWMLGLRWDIAPAIMVRGEYHIIDGTSWLSSADNPDRSLTDRNWDLFAIQISYRF